MSLMIDPATPRLIEMRLNRARLWRWQLELAQRLTVDRGFDLVVRFADGPRVPAERQPERAIAAKRSEQARSERTRAACELLRNAPSAEGGGYQVA